jgi:WD40 repeat protein
MGERAGGEATSEERIGEVLGCYLEAAEAGQAPPRAELLAQHPELAGELAAFFSEQEQFERMVAPLRQAVEAAFAPEPTEADPDATMPPMSPAEPQPGEGTTTVAGETIAAPPPTGRGGQDGDGSGGEGGDDGSGEADEPLPRGSRVRYFGDYELKGVLGRGGMGVVYRARQLSLNRPVALKMIRAGIWAGGDEVRRFRNEAEAVALLDHPRIVAIYEVGQAHGRHYFSMKLVEGPALDTQLGRYAADPRAAARLVAEVARAVHHAHQRGILHRDLKPSNILLDPEGRPHVTDFGLARRIGGDGALSASGTVVGTPQYMSPEQAEGRRDSVTTATEVYGLGAILYATMTGRPPFDSDSVVETLRLVREQPPAPPSRLDRRIDRDLETIALKCLEKDPRRRYGSADAVADDLERYLAHVPILARRAGPIEHAAKWARRNPAVAGLAAAVAALLVATAVGATLAAVHLGLRAEREERLRGQALAAEQRAVDRAREVAEKADELERSLYYNRIALVDSELAVPAPNAGRVEELLEECPPGLRGWEWDYLRRHRLGRPLVLRGHTGYVGGVAFSHDGRRLASAGSDGAVKVWDVGRRAEALTLQETAYWTFGMAFSADGRRLTSAGVGGIVTVWDAETGARLATLTGHAPPVVSVAFSPDGRRLASVGMDQTIRIWDAELYRKARTLYPDSRCFEVAYSPDGRYLASAGEDGAVKLWDAATGREILSLRGHDDFIFSLAYSPDGRRLASGSNDRTVRVWDATPLGGPSEPGPLTLRGNGSHVGRLAFSRDGTRLAGGDGEPARVLLWDTGHLARGAVPEAVVLRGHTGPVPAVAFSPDGRRLATGSADGTVKVRDAADGRELFTIRVGHFLAMAYRPDGRAIATTSGTNAVRIWDAATGVKLGDDLRGHTDWPEAVAYSPDGARVASGSQDQTVRVWDPAAGREALCLRGHTGIVNGVAYSPDGRKLASAAGDKTVRIWDAAVGREIRTLRGHTDRVFDVAFSPDSTRLASAGLDGTVRIWEVETGREVDTLRGHSGHAYGVAYSPDGRWLAVSCGYRDRGEVKVWDLTSREAPPHGAAPGDGPAPPGWRDHWALGRFHADAGRWEAAVAEYARAVGERPDDPDLRAGQARLLARLGRPDEAAADFARALELLPPDPGVRSAGDRLVDELAADETVFARVLALRPDDPLLRCARGRVLARHGRWEVAATEYARGVEPRATSQLVAEYTCLPAAPERRGDGLPPPRRPDGRGRRPVGRSGWPLPAGPDRRPGH